MHLAGGDVHDVDLRVAAAVGDKGEAPPVRGPGGGAADPLIGGEPIEDSADRVHEIEVGVAVLAQGGDQGLAARGPGGRHVEAPLPGDGLGGLVLGEVGDVEVRVAAVVGGVGQSAAVGGEAGRDGQAFVAGDLTHVLPQDIRQIDLLLARLAGDKGDLGVADPLFAGELEDHLITQLEEHGAVLGPGRPIALAGHHLVAVGVQELPFDDHLIGLVAVAAKDDKINTQGAPVGLAVVLIGGAGDHRDEAVEGEGLGHQIRHLLPLVGDHPGGGLIDKGRDGDGEFF